MPSSLQWSVCTHKPLNVRRSAPATEYPATYAPTCTRGKEFVKYMEKNKGQQRHKYNSTRPTEHQCNRVRHWERQDRPTITRQSNDQPQGLHRRSKRWRETHGAFQNETFSLVPKWVHESILVIPRTPFMDTCTPFKEKYHDNVSLFMIVYRIVPF